MASELEKQRKAMEDDFGKQRAKFKEMFLLKEGWLSLCFCFAEVAITLFFFSQVAEYIKRTLSFVLVLRSFV